MLSVRTLREELSVRFIAQTLCAKRLQGLHELLGFLRLLRDLSQVALERHPRRDVRLCPELRNDASLEVVASILRVLDLLGPVSDLLCVVVPSLGVLEEGGPVRLLLLVPVVLLGLQVLEELLLILQVL